MARPLIPFVQNGYYASRNWIPLVKGNGFTTSGGGEQEEVWETASGSIVTFDAVAAPLRQLSVAVEPVQNLNGYDAPWPAGGGKNLLTALPSPGTTVWFCEPDGFLFKANQTYCFSIGDDVTVGSYSIYAADKTTQLAYASSYRKVVYTPTVDTVGYPRLYAGEGVSQEAINSAQLELGDSRTTFAPYSNICPISGWTEAKVWRTGKNLLKITMQSSAGQQGVDTTINDDGTVTINGTTTAFAGRALGNVSLKKGVTYYLSGAPNLGSPYATYLYRSGVGMLARETGAGASYTATEDMTVSFYISVNGGTTVNNVVFKPMLSTSSDTAFAAYSGNTYTIQLGETVYGGTLDVTNGVLTVDRRYTTIGNESVTAVTGTNYSNFQITPASGSKAKIAPSEFVVISSAFNGYSFDAAPAADDNYVFASGGNLRIKNTANAALSANEWKALMTSVELCYLLATPVTYQLTPEQISTVQGTNNVWGDAGDVTVEYRAQ